MCDFKLIERKVGKVVQNCSKKEIYNDKYILDKRKFITT